MDSPIYSDCDDIPEVSFTMEIQPYMYEPEATANTSFSSDSSQSENEFSDDSDLGSYDNGTTLHWCSCGHCTAMATPEERKCCADMNVLEDKLEGISCITLHEGFIANCTNIHVLETCFYEYVDENGPVDEESLHKLYRHIACRRFIRWIRKRLGKKNRRVIPSCAVRVIREAFPSESYTGFKYPRC